MADKLINWMIYRDPTQNLYVDSDIAANRHQDGSAAKPFDTIQEAIDKAVTGARINIGPGTYTEKLDTGGKSLSFQGSGVQSTKITWAGAGDPTFLSATGEFSMQDLHIEHSGANKAIDADNDGSATDPNMLSSMLIDGDMDFQAAHTFLDNARQLSGTLTGSNATGTPVSVAQVTAADATEAASTVAAADSAVTSTSIAAADMGATASTVAAADASAVVQADAPDQTAAYVEADVDAIRDLANANKVVVNTLVTLANETKADYNALHADVATAKTLADELKADFNLLLTDYTAAVTLMNEMKADYNALHADYATAVTLANELKAKMDAMNA